jgi:hypothetical protein
MNLDTPGVKVIVWLAVAALVLGFAHKVLHDAAQCSARGGTYVRTLGGMVCMKGDKVPL